MTSCYMGSHKKWHPSKKSRYARAIEFGDGFKLELHNHLITKWLLTSLIPRPPLDFVSQLWRNVEIKSGGGSLF